MNPTLLFAGWQVTLTGHSLGAGVASLLACLLKEEGVRQLRCYAFEPPAVMGRHLAESCAGVGAAVARGLSRGLG